MQLEKLCLRRLDRGEALEGLIHGEQSFVARGSLQGIALQLHAAQLAAALGTALPTGILHQDPPHRFGGRHEEVLAVGERVVVAGPTSRM